jgi:hypothetical protein
MVAAHRVAPGVPWRNWTEESARYFQVIAIESTQHMGSIIVDTGRIVQSVGRAPCLFSVGHCYP